MNNQNKRIPHARSSPSTARALSGVLVGTFGLFGVIATFYIHAALENNFGELQQRDFERRIATYATLLNYFIDVHSNLVEDLARDTIFAQSVMQPQAMQASLQDHMRRIRVMGKPVQMTLLDFEGTPVASSQPSPVFNYREEPWVDRMMSGQITNYFGFHQNGHGYFLTFATVVVYNGLPEGILLAEIPASALTDNDHWPEAISQEQLQLFQGDERVVTLGPDVSANTQSSIDLPERNLTLVGYLDDQQFLHMISHTMLQHLVGMLFLLALGAVVLIFLLCRKLFIRPIESLRQMTNQIASGQFLRERTSDDSEDMSLRYRLLEINDLAVDIRSMAEIIGEREKSLQDANSTLEQRVKERTRALQVAHDEALSASRAKSGFLATMSHEIRTPMNAILGILGLLREAPLDSRLKQLVQTGRESGELLLSIINDILDFSKMEADKLQLEHIDFDLHRLLDQTVELMTPQAERKGLVLELVREPELPHYAEGDPDRLRQILLNLINNAIKFTPAGHICVSVSGEPAHDGQFVCRCAVQDTGVGIPETFSATLFDEFTMADQSYARTHEGTGLGLAICKRLVSLMGGDISVSTEVGNGSTFVFTVVLASADAMPCNSDSALPAPVSLPGADTRILLAEDNPANQLVIRRILEHAGLQVDIVGNGREAVEAVRSLPYDIVLMDISMPEMDGMAAAHEIRQLPRAVGRVPIIALTAHALAGDRQRFLQAGMNDYLTKPIDRAAIIEGIARWTQGVGKPISDAVPETARQDMPENAHVDESVLLQLVKDTAAGVVPELIKLYVEDARKRVSRIEGAITAEDYDILEFETHTLGSSAAAHGNPRVHTLAREVEHHCRNGHHDQAITDATQLVVVATESLHQLAQRSEKGFG